MYESIIGHPGRFWCVLVTVFQVSMRFQQMLKYAILLKYQVSQGSSIPYEGIE
jgi:hypothetical protein